MSGTAKWSARRHERLIEMNDGFQQSSTTVRVSINCYEENKPRLSIYADSFTFKSRRQVLELCRALQDGLQMLDEAGCPLE